MARRIEGADGHAMAEVSVADTDVGIAPEDHEWVFDEFRQAGDDYLRKAEGTGLGLSLRAAFRRAPWRHAGARQPPGRRRHLHPSFCR